MTDTITLTILKNDNDLPGKHTGVVCWSIVLFLSCFEVEVGTCLCHHARIESIFQITNEIDADCHTVTSGSL